MLEDFSAAIFQFHFLRPFWLLGVLPALLLPIALFYRQVKMGSWHSVIKAEFQPYLLSGETQINTSLPFYIMGFAWVTATLILAGPTWQKLPQEIHKKVEARIIILDQSYSMLSTDVKPDRNTRAKHKLTDLLAQFDEGTTALIVYAGDAHVVTPLTEDTRTIANLSPSLTPLIMPVAGNNLVHAIQKTKQLLTNANLGQGEVFLLTDGIEAQQIEALNELLEGINVTVNVLGIGTVDGAPIPLPDGSFLKNDAGSIILPQLDRPSLLKFSKQHGGRYSDIKNNDADIEYLTEEGINYRADQLEATERQFDSWREEGPWLLLLLMPLFVIAFRKGWLAQILLPISLVAFCAQPNISQAGIWQDLWSTGDQQGTKAFQQENWQTASEQFNSAQWKGSSFYRNNDYQQAIEEFSKDSSTTGYYNQGNALANAGQLEEAIEAYQQSLVLNPDHKDAQFNLQLVEKMLEEQEQEQQKSEDNQDSDNQDSDNQDGEKSDEGQEGENQQSQNQDSQSGDSKESQSDNDDASKPDSSKPNPDEKDSDEESSSAQEEQRENQQEEQNQSAQKDQQQQDDASAQEKEKALQQWLGRIPDDPGGLLRQKFLYESQTAAPDTQTDGKPW